MLSVITRVGALPFPDASLDEGLVCPTISVAEAVGEVGTLEDIAMIVSVPAEEAGVSESMLDFAKLEEPGPAVREVGTVVLGDDTATGVIVEGPATVPGVGGVER